MPIVPISGVNVEFPKAPYECQVTYMQKVLQAMSSGTNALLESPTGTGKTLSLLCASLAWQKQHNRRLERIEPTNADKSAQFNQFNVSKDGSGTNAPNANQNVVIIYATRTHSQLNQVIRELQSTAYRPKMAVLGSREQLCIHDKVSKLKGSAINHACATLTSQRGCRFRNNLDSDGSSILVSQEEVVDIEDIAAIGRRKAICPYFYSRDLSASADIIFMPYNYLLDASIRKTTKIPFQNAVVIFDEAHNLEQVSSDAASCTLTSADIAACIKELQQVLTTLNNDLARGKEDKNSSGKSDGSSFQSKPDVHLTMAVLRSCFALEQQLDAVQLSKHEATNTMCSVLPGKWLVDLLMAVGFQSDQHIETVRKCGAFLVDAAEEALGGGSMSGPSGHAPEPKLAAFYTALERILHTGRQEHQDFQVYIADEETKKTKSSNISTFYQDASSRRATRRVVNFMCFSTGVALKELTKLGVRSLILTSGTLSPMEAMKEDLKLPFMIELQNPHVIKTNQIWVGALGKGPKNITLTSSFVNRSNVEAKDELGSTILEIACSLLGTPSSIRTALSGTLAPTVSFADLPKIKGGVLVFFPAYHILENTIERWQFSGLYQQFVSAAGSVIVETKASSAKKPEGANGGASAFGNTGGFGSSHASSSKPAKQLDDDNNEEEQQEAVLSNLVKQFERTIASKGSCILLAVCRGKVAEGVDFSDNKGRVVIVTGIPFAPFMDPWVALKKAYLDRKTMANALPTSNPAAAPGGPGVVANVENNLWASAVANAAIAKPSSGQEVGFQAGPKGVAIKHLTGQMWYNQSAARAVNQCLGRVIRHQNDWGAIFLLDDRFLADRQLYQISKWMRPMVKKYFTAKDALTSFRAFLGHIARDDSLHPVMAPPSAQIQDKPASKAPPKAEQQRAPPNPFNKFVEISESELPSSTQEPACFIQQQLLASQQQPRRSIRPTSSNDDDDYNSIVQFTQPRMTQGSSHMDIISSQSSKDKSKGPMDLGAKLAILKTKESHAAPASKVLINQPYGKPFGDDLLFSQKSNSSSGGQIIDLFNDDKLEDDVDDGFGLSAPSIPLSQATPSSQSQVATPNEEPKAKLSSSILSQAFKGVKSTPAGGKAVSSSKSATEGYVLEILSQIKTKVSTDEMTKLKELFGNVKRQGGLQNLTQVKEFQEDFVGIVSSGLSLEEQTNALRGLKILVGIASSGSSSSHYDSQDRLRDIYLQQVNQRYERLLKKRRFEEADIKQEQPSIPAAVPPPTSGGALGGSGKVGSNAGGAGGVQLNSGIQKETKTSQLAFGSSRAQHMLQRVQGASSAAATDRNSSMMSKIEQISDFSMGSQPKLQGLGATSALSSKYIANTSKLQCCVCKETAVQPCAAKCGHVCCQDCWARCLQVKPMCPMCRASTTKDSISKLLVRASTS